jgi:hypothetical protein
MEPTEPVACLPAIEVVNGYAKPSIDTDFQINLHPSTGTTVSGWIAAC